MTGRSLVDTLRGQSSGQKQLRFGAVIGRVKNNRDTEGLGRVQLEFDFDWQGSHHKAWAMPVYPLSGDLGLDVPDEGDLLVCLFLDGSNTQPFYLGKLRGRPKQEEAAALTKETQDYVRLAAAEEVEKQMGEILRWLRTHTHQVTVVPQGIGNLGAPIAGLPSTATTMPAKEKVPDLVRVGVRKIRLTKRCKPQQDKEKMRVG